MGMGMDGGGVRFSGNLPQISGWFNEMRLTIANCLLLPSDLQLKRFPKQNFLLRFWFSIWCKN